MITFDTWFSQIVHYIRFVEDARALRKAWIAQDFSDTSVIDFDELFEQIFDDLDADALEHEMLNTLSDRQQRDAVSGFLAAMRTLDATRSKDQRLTDAVVLLASGEWRSLQRQASDALLVLDRANDQ